jgi:hypothetical protein
LSCSRATAVLEGRSQTITLGGTASGGTLVLNGATLSFAVVFQASPPMVQGVVPHGN